MINEDGIVLRGENAVLDAKDTYVTNRPVISMYDGLAFEWVCPNQVAVLCAGKNGKSLEIK